MLNKQIISSTPNNLPQLTGVYIFKNSANQIIYIGKAKNIKKRVSSYFTNKTNDWKIKDLIGEYRSLEYIITKNEIEALILEAQMIKEFHPKFNVLLKSGNPYLYIVITSEAIPKIKLVRVRKEKGQYFGPFMQKQKARTVFNYLINTFQLEFCKSKMEQGCLKYHLNKCVGNCLKNFDLDGYITRLQLVKDILTGDIQASETLLLSKIKEYNSKFEFEKSKNLANYLENLKYIFQTIKIDFREENYLADIAHIQTNKSDNYEATIALIELKKLLNFDRDISSIDCFDISHIQSHAIVGSCIRFTNGLPDKKNFRKFKIKTLKEQNDYAALQEIVTRRYKNMNELPDVILIDGGKGQLNSINKLGIHTNIISLAKAEEILYTSNHPEGIKLDLKTPMGKLLIQLRDYAHHFAITYHRLLRSRNSY